MLVRDVRSPPSLQLDNSRAQSGRSSGSVLSQMSRMGCNCPDDKSVPRRERNSRFAFGGGGGAGFSSETRERPETWEGDIDGTGEGVSRPDSGGTSSSSLGSSGLISVKRVARSLMPSRPNLLLPISQYRTPPSLTAAMNSLRISVVTPQSFILKSPTRKHVGIGIARESTDSLDSQAGGSTTTMDELSELCMAGVAGAAGSCVSDLFSVSAICSGFSSMTSISSETDGCWACFAGEVGLITRASSVPKPVELALRKENFRDLGRVMTGRSLNSGGISRRRGLGSAMARESS
jgi:hypothetical protein